MKYIPPKDDAGTPYYVPIVAKSYDFLIGYIQGVQMSRDIIKDVLESIHIDVDIGQIDVLLDSTRFNDILLNGKYESEMTTEEKKSYIFDIVEEVTNKLTYENSENNIDFDDVLNVECSCGLGFYSWKDVLDIPKTNFTCTNCGKMLIYYTGIYDSEYEYYEGRYDG